MCVTPPLPPLSSCFLSHLQLINKAIERPKICLTRRPVLPQVSVLISFGVFWLFFWLKTSHSCYSVLFCCIIQYISLLRLADGNDPLATCDRASMFLYSETKTTQITYLWSYQVCWAGWGGWCRGLFCAGIPHSGFLGPASILGVALSAIPHQADHLLLHSVSKITAQSLGIT